MRRILFLCGWLSLAATSVEGVAVPLPGPEGGSAEAPTLQARAPAASRSLDRAVFMFLRKRGIPHAGTCPDHVFLRRAYLDLGGRLPTLEECKRFLEDEKPGKRAALIDELLARREFADLWAMRWCDVLRVKSEFPINLWPNAVQAYYQWVWTSLRENKPYDRFVRELLTSDGSNFRVPPVNFYRALQSRDPRSIAKAVALTFMGARAEKWPKGRLDAMAMFFSRIAYKRTAEWKEEIVYFDATRPPPGEGKDEVEPIFPDGRKARIEPGRDPRAVFADWLIRKDNPWFAKALVNRVWAWLFGRGVVHEADDLRPDNPPSNPALLDALAKTFTDSGYDLHALLRAILNSRVYQQDSIPPSQEAADESLFACYPIHRLDAEILIDALCDLTGTRERYSSVIPEPFTWIPPSLGAIRIPDGSISSPTLEVFGRPPRDTGVMSERSSKVTADQRLQLLNASRTILKIERGTLLRPILRNLRRNPRRAITELYLRILSRYPDQEELRLLDGIDMKNWRARRDALVDLAWALINSAEFQFQH